MGCIAQCKCTPFLTLFDADMFRSFRIKIKLLFRKLCTLLKGLPETQLLMLLGVVVGLCSGFAAVILKSLIHFFEWILTGWFNTPVDSYLYLIYPGVGMLLSLLFVKFIVKDDIGHGVTKVLLAVSRKRSKIKRHNIWTSLVASSVTIGFGGSVGAEAPIVYTGAALGSNIGRKIGLTYKQITILLGCGAASAVAGIFKAPMAGILFTLEILMFNVSVISIVPLLLSCVTATCISYIFLGDNVSFHSTIEIFSMGNIPYYIALGIFCGLMSIYFTRTTLYMEDKIKSINNSYKRWFISAIFLGILIFLFPPLYGEGYDSLNTLLNNKVNPLEIVKSSPFPNLFFNPWVVPVYFFLVMIFKVFAMSFTNAGGGVGGTFGPTLIVGGIAGFVLSRVINLSGIHLVPEENFALVGMAGLMAGVMQAPMTAIFLIAEITGGYSLLIPLIIASTISFVTTRFVEKYSIYTKRIAKQGDLLTHDSDQAVLTLLRTEKFIENDFTSISTESSLGDLVEVVAKSSRNIYPVVDKEGIFKGVIYLDDIRDIMFHRELYDAVYVYNIVKDASVVVEKDEKMESVVKKFENSGAWNLPVVDADGKYLGFISKSKLFLAYREQLQEVSHE